MKTRAFVEVKMKLIYVWGRKHPDLLKLFLIASCLQIFKTRFKFFLQVLHQNIRLWGVFSLENSGCSPGMLQCHCRRNCHGSVSLWVHSKINWERSKSKLLQKIDFSEWIDQMNL